MNFFKHIRLGQSIVVALFMYNCKEQYLPPVLRTNKNFLVVEGVIITGGDSTVIKLSRTANVADTILPQPEPGATVTVVAQDGTMYPLADRGDGSYFSAGFNLDASKKYQLSIHTASGSMYQSDFVAVKLTPPIDSVGWYQDTANNVQIFLSTHDPLNNSRYYRWDYAETWQYRAATESRFDWVNGQPVIRSPDNQIYNCWSSDNSTTVQIASTAKLSQDVIYQQPVSTVPFAAEKLSKKYSILVKQYALTQDAYNFWQNLKTATQQLGTLFDAQPAQLQGNIHSITKPDEVVVGYVSASSVQAKRIFISFDDIRWFHYTPYYSYYLCDTRSVPPDSMDYYFPPSGARNWVFIGSTPLSPNYDLLPADCADCRTHGGTNVKPAYWQ
jgi:hypothetical protein